jgi:polar amino acid transport system substrate-binding protein
MAREALSSSQADVLFDDGLSLGFWLNGTLSNQCCEFRGGPFLEPRFFGDGMGIAVPKKDQALRAQLNAALRRVRSSGRLEEIVARYFPLRLY